MKKNIKILLLIIWLGLIFFLSSRPEDFFPKESFDYGALAHLLLYAILSFLFADLIFSLERKWTPRHVFWFSLFFSIFYGITDEYHQGFVEGRTPSFVDLVFDGLGAIVGSIGLILYKTGKPKLLLHICCIGCGAHIIQELKKDFKLELFFYNPNIFPAKEYQIRLEEAERVAKKFGIKLTVGGDNHREWLKSVKGLEAEPERGGRCLVCYRDRLERAVESAKEKGFDFFATTLTISPHKDARAIGKISKELEQQYGVKYLDKDFKENDGFKKSCQLSRELNLYRQSYCGCEFSIRRQAGK